ncbi:hypothetical protein ElyMa_003378800 [Elysia marginata]|uniref:Uncharacterized protein n=1 Tax=Elysia marginata TaxID=1093978 RepID=A0AAV4JMQ6_9GAST|nr:hypothetical protein ElyMa_003378800 [Elysia marginata]
MVDRLVDSTATNGLSNSLAYAVTLPDDTQVQGLANTSHVTDPPAPGATDQWKVTKNTSLFDYTKPSMTSYEEVNVHEDFTPQVLPMEVTQLQALFTDETKRNQGDHRQSSNISLTSITPRVKSQVA